MTGTLPADRALPCPGCARGKVDGAGDAVCSGKRCAVEVLRFPVLADLVPDGSSGRCARHPGKDGVASCGRCGGFVCEVCATRTGDQVLCPACFDLLHGRGELATTRTTRFRVDQLALALALVGWLCYGVGIPLALGFGIWGLRRRRTDPWISKSYCWTAVALSALQLLGIAVLIVVAIAAGKD